MVKKPKANSPGIGSQDEIAPLTKSKSIVVTRGEVWLAVLDPTIGGEIQKTRPCLIISPAEMHNYLRTVTIAPMTTASRPAPFRIAISFGGKEGLILLDQIRTLDKQRLIKRLGVVDHGALRITLARLQDMFEE